MPAMLDSTKVSMPLSAKITESARANRAAEVRQALASIRMEGLEPGEAALAIFRRYENGDLTLEQMGLEIKALHDRQHGPIRLSGNRHT